MVSCAIYLPRRCSNSTAYRICHGGFHTVCRPDCAFCSKSRSITECHWRSCASALTHAINRPQIDRLYEVGRLRGCRRRRCRSSKRGRLQAKPGTCRTALCATLWLTGYLQAFSIGQIFALGYQSIGVIYGDIGTSPLYVFSSVFTEAPSHIDLLGALSLVLWSITLMVTVKYILLILHADNDGEGGTFSTYSLLSRYVSISVLAESVCLAK